MLSAQEANFSFANFGFVSLGEENRREDTRIKMGTQRTKKLVDSDGLPTSYNPQKKGTSRNGMC